MIGHRFWITMALLAFATIASEASAGPFDNVLKRMEDSVGRRTEDLGDKAVNRTFDGAENAAACAVGDEDCLRRQREQAAKAPTAATPAAAAPAVARCVATDTDCLKDAKTRGLYVQIIDESELDTIRCKIGDTDCMQRAKKLGKKVELTD